MTAEVDRRRMESRDGIENSVRLVKRLANAGKTHREISKKTKLSRSIIGRITRGEITVASVRSYRDRNEKATYEEPKHEPHAYRCGGCGFLVYYRPCLICRSRI